MFRIYNPGNTPLYYCRSCQISRLDPKKAITKMSNLICDLGEGVNTNVLNPAHICPPSYNKSR
jgi:hypothetical protein